MIDNCPHLFDQLASTVLPSYAAQLQRSLANPSPMADFAERGVGAKTLLKRYGRTKDFSGCYVLVEKGKPIYVGISRTVFQRLARHVKGTSHFDATLAYRMSESSMNTPMTRAERMADDEFGKLFAGKKKDLATLGVAYVEIETALELHVFEPYCAMMLDTCEWNTFRTH